MNTPQSRRPSFAKVRDTWVFQAELAWWVGATVKGLRARIASDQAWYGTATITSTSPGKDRRLAGSGQRRTLADPTAALTDVWGLDPLQAVDVTAVAAEARCSVRFAHRGALAPLKAHLDRVRAEIDARLSNPDIQRRAAASWQASRDALQSRRVTRFSERIRNEMLPELIGAGVTEGDWISWYQLALVGGVMDWVHIHAAYESGDFSRGARQRSRACAAFAHVVLEAHAERPSMIDRPGLARRTRTGLIPGPVAPQHLSRSRWVPC